MTPPAPLHGRMPEKSLIQMALLGYSHGQMLHRSLAWKTYGPIGESHIALCSLCHPPPQPTQVPLFHSVPSSCQGLLQSLLVSSSTHKASSLGITSAARTDRPSSRIRSCASQILGNGPRVRWQCIPCRKRPLHAHTVPLHA
jgi:hypothetical protein